MSHGPLTLPSLDEVVAERCRRRFFRFFCEAWPTIETVPLKLDWHIEYLCDELQACLERWERGESQPDTLINIPPGTSKSSIVTILFPAWCWVRHPQMRIINGSYSGFLSTEHAVKTRDCLKSDWFRRLWPGLIEMKDDTDGKTHYKNTRGGERLATSVGGSVMGVHADLIIWDDPINTQQASSEPARAEANRFVSDTLPTRKTDKERTFTIGVMQRLHQDDPTGRALRERPEEINHICLPGELTADVRPAALADRYVDGLLAPLRLSRVALQKQRTALGSAGYAGQFLQNPMEAGGNLLKKVWFGRMRWEEFQQLHGQRVRAWDFDADTAYTASQSNDPSALMASTYLGQTLYIRGVAEVWKELPDLLKFIPVFLARYGYSRHSRLHVEPKASGLSTVQSLRSISQLNVILAPSPKDDKETRVNNAAPFVEAGRVVLLYDEPDTPQGWQENFVDQCCAFPRGLHDDQLDDLTQAITRAIATPPRTRSALAELIH